MDKNHELYYEEIDSLRKFRSKIDTHAIYKEDLDEFSDEYEELVAQAKVITRVSDRLQKKLDSANVQIRAQNEEIKQKNVELADTVDQLAKAQIGRRASAIMLVVGILLFLAEQIFLEPWIDQNIDIPYVGFGILIILFFVVKMLESALENYFMSRRKKEILRQEASESNEKGS